MAESGRPWTVTAQYRRVGSSNDVAKLAAAAGAPEGYAVVAVSQSAGRGRLGRRFHSPEGTGLYISLVLRPGTRLPDPWVATVAAAVAMSEAISGCFNIETSIKWVNDLYLGERKVCGILTESAAGPRGPLYVVPGTGVNLEPPKDGFPGELQELAGALFPPGGMPEGGREMLAREYLRRLQEIYLSLPGGDLLERYRRRSMLTGRRVLVPGAQGGVRPATVLGIAEDFGLMVRYDDGSGETLTTGEVSVQGFRQTPRLV